MNNFYKKNDRELVTLMKDKNTSRRDYNQIAEVLFKRYEDQIHKNWWKIMAQLNESYRISSMKEDFYSEAYNAMLTAISKININKIRDNNWKLVGYFDFYLKNVRTKIINQIKKECVMNSIEDYMITNEKEDKSKLNDFVETSWYTNEGYKNDTEYVAFNEIELKKTTDAIYKCYERWNERKKFIFDELLEETPKKEIAKKLKIDPTLVYIACKEMKKDIVKEIESTN